MLAHSHIQRYFHFSKISEVELKEEILNLTSLKVTSKGEIPATTLKESNECLSGEWCDGIINDHLKKRTFLDDSKIPHMSPIS